MFILFFWPVCPIRYFTLYPRIGTILFFNHTYLKRLRLSDVVLQCCDGIADIVDYDQTTRTCRRDFIWIYAVYSGLLVQIIRIGSK